jgi:protein-S-isoprenylcysteine O-methyltransferase Ste14
MRKRALTIKLLVVALLGVVLFSHHPFAEGSMLDQSFEAVGYILLAAAAIGRLWCAAYISGNKKSSLVVSGPYSLVRNPLYFFSMLGFIGAGFALESFTVAALFAAIFALTHMPAIRAEEEKLDSLFGNEFTAYRDAVPSFFPRSLRMTQPDRLEFSPRLFNRAVRECALILLVFVLAHTLEWLHQHGIVPIYFHLP